MGNYRVSGEELSFSPADAHLLFRGSVEPGETAHSRKLHSSKALKMSNSSKSFTSLNLQQHNRAWSGRAFLAAVTVLAFLVPAGMLQAGDEPEHRHLTYAIAIASGYSPAEAKIISDGAWSLDTNRSTWAFNGVQEDAG